MIEMEKIFEITRAADTKFGMTGPFEVLARLTEELGEIASEVNAIEGSKSKLEKGESGSELPAEMVDLLKALAALIDHYDLLDQVNERIRQSHQRWRDDGYIE